MELKTQNIESPSKVQSGANKPVDEDLNQEYIDVRKITISPVRNYSDYRKANIINLGPKKETIGSSITSSRILSSNQGEVEAYFPSLIGLSPNNPEFITRVKAWLSNIQFIITDDKELDISFKYNTKKDYLDFRKREDAIDAAYDKADRSDTEKIKAAIKLRVNAINTLESEKHKVGRPINIEEYLMYRHCLLYRDVAKDIALINSDPALRFYIKDVNKEAEKQKKLVLERKTAIRNFMELGASPSKFNAVYIAVVAQRNENISMALLKTDSEKDNILMNFANEQPDKFNKLVKDSNIITKALIETLIVRGELVRAEFNQQISTADGNFIGSNMNEAVAYFNNPANKDVRSVYENKLKMF